jgi:hypothetical protein
MLCRERICKLNQLSNSFERLCAGPIQILVCKVHICSLLRCFQRRPVHSYFLTMLRTAAAVDAAIQHGMLYNEQIGNGGIIYTPGSAGTRQEVFQAACRNHYAPTGSEVLRTIHLSIALLYCNLTVCTASRALGYISVQSSFADFLVYASSSSSSRALLYCECSFCLTLCNVHASSAMCYCYCSYCCKYCCTCTGADGFLGRAVLERQLYL